MVSLQIISKILHTHDLSILETYLLPDEAFVGYENELAFIKEHYKKYDNVPDEATFLSSFPEFTLVEVTENDEYLADKLREEYLYYKAVPVVQKVAELLRSDSNAAVEYMLQSVKNLQPNYSLGGVDIISSVQDRYDSYLERGNDGNSWVYSTGFEELDDIIGGIRTKEELFVITARINQGKSWILEKICAHVWQLGFTVGFVSPEMSAESVGFRFDTLFKHFSNKELMWGNSKNDYSEYIDEIKSHKNQFVVATPIDFDRKITVTKLRRWIKQHHLNLLAIDGITYLTDERAKRGDNKTTTLTNISEDLITLSVELELPILIVVQANRNGITTEEEDGTPELEHIKDSDGIGANATHVISLRQKNDDILEIGVKKNRNGPVNKSVKYKWHIDTGEFEYCGDSYTSSKKSEVTRHERQVRPTNKKVDDIF